MYCVKPPRTSLRSIVPYMCDPVIPLAGQLFLPAAPALSPRQHSMDSCTQTIPNKQCWHASPRLVLAAVTMTTASCVS